MQMLTFMVKSVCFHDTLMFQIEINPRKNFSEIPQMRCKIGDEFIYDVWACNDPA